MPDTWEYPWFAAWDLAFHCIPLALIDPDFAKEQLILLGREWYQHPNGQIPAYEWAFGDVNPPVLAWAAWRVYKIDQKQRGAGDRAFLERVFHKLLLNFTWWVNRKDAEGNNVFQGGFLGLDNIGVFDRSAPLPTGGHIEQSDGTSWMGMFCLNMLTIALELAVENRVYERHRHQVLRALPVHRRGDEQHRRRGHRAVGRRGRVLLRRAAPGDGTAMPLKVRSMVGLIPLFAVDDDRAGAAGAAAGVRTRLEWFLEHRPHLAQPGLALAGAGRGRAAAAGARARPPHEARAAAHARRDRVPLAVRRARALARTTPTTRMCWTPSGTHYTVEYQPAESNSGLFGGNSNWRGPIWFPVNYLMIESLQQFHHYYGDDFKVECPTGSGQYLTLSEIADELSRRLIQHLPARRSTAGGAVFGEQELLPARPALARLRAVLRVLPRRHRRGRRRQPPDRLDGLVAKLIQQQGEHSG